MRLSRLFLSLAPSLLLAAATPAAIWGGLLLAAILAERWRYRQAAPQVPGEGWVGTEERFIDPETGKTLRVWYDPRTGARRYVEAAPGAGSGEGVPPNREA